MRKLLKLLTIFFTVLVLSLPAHAAYNTYWATTASGGTTGAMDAINGNLLADGDKCVVQTSSGVSHYHLNATSGASESIPNIIAPDTNPGTKRWLLSSADNKYYVNAAAADQGVNTDRSIKNLVDTIGGTKKATLVLTHDGVAAETTYTLTTSETVTDNITLEKEPGAILDGAGTLTINGPFKSGLDQAFGSNITILGLKSAYPEWWLTNTTPGTTNMATAVQAALDSVGSGGEIIISSLMGIGAASWVGITVTSKDDITIRGIHPGAGFKCLVAPSQTMTGYGYAILFKFDTVDRLHIKDLYIEGNDIATNLIGLDTVTNSIIENNFITNTSEGTYLSGIYAQTCSGNIYKNNEISHTYHALHLGNTNNDSDKEVSSLIADNYLHDNSADGVVGHFTKCQITRNRCIDNSSSGIAFGSGLTNTDAQIIISENICIGNGFHGIQVDSGTVLVDVNIKNNICQENAYSGIHGTIGHKFIITGNICRDNNYGDAHAGSAGIVLASNVAGNMAHFIVTNNICYDSRAGGSQEQDFGIYLAATTGAAAISDIDINNNQCFNNDQDGIHITNSGTGTMNGINISANTCKDNAERGIEIAAVAVGNISDITLKNNIIHDNTVADFTEQYIMNYKNAHIELTGSPALNYEEASVLDSSGGAITATLGNGYFIGQIKTIVMTEASTSSTVSITNHQTSDPEVATFDAVDETGVFMWTGTEWITIFATCTFL